MLETVLIFGLVIFIGLALVLVKLPTRITLRLLNHCVAVDIAVTLLVLWIHWGTMTGLMSATVAGIICSIVTSAARKLFGHIQGGRYYPGLYTLKEPFK